MTTTTNPARPGEAHAQRARPNGVQTHSVSGCRIVGKDTRVLEELASSEVYEGVGCQQENASTHVKQSPALSNMSIAPFVEGDKRSQNRTIVSFSPCLYGSGGLKGIGLYPSLGQGPFARCPISTPTKPGQTQKAAHPEKRTRRFDFCIEIPHNLGYRATNSVNPRSKEESHGQMYSQTVDSASRRGGYGSARRAGPRLHPAPGRR